MFGQDKIHEELHKYSQKDEEEQLHSWNILNLRKIKPEEQLSQWNTTSYRVMPRIKKKALHRPISPSNPTVNLRNTRNSINAPLLQEQLNHRYTFLNQHSHNDQNQQQIQQMLIRSPKNIQLKLPKQLKNGHLPTIHQQAHYKLMKTRSRSFIDSKSATNASIYFIRHHNQMKSKILQKQKNPQMYGAIQSMQMTQSLAEIKSLKRARAQKLTMKRKSRSPRYASPQNSADLKNCLIFSSKKR